MKQRAQQIRSTGEPILDDRSWLTRDEVRYLDHAGREAQGRDGR